MTREQFTTLNKYRLAFICTFHASPDETPQGVPAEARAAFEADVEYHTQSRERIFDQVCVEHGAGLFEDLSSDARAAAVQELEYLAATFENACRYELEIQRINSTEALEKAFDESLSLNVVRAK
jgi:hypothetical protein